MAYLDIDVHHGDGVQQILYDDKRVMTISLHESGQYLFPGTGQVHELGSGLGRGLKLNLPLQPFTEGRSYLEVFDQVVPEALRHFRPGVLVVQAGADAHADDPLADLMLTTRDYEAIFRRILEAADTFTAGRVLFTLGGGYSLRATPRVWALLYPLIHDLPVAADLPAAWRTRWSACSGRVSLRRFTIPSRARSRSRTARKSRTATGRSRNGCSRPRVNTGFERQGAPAFALGGASSSWFGFAHDAPHDSRPNARGGGSVYGSPCGVYTEGRSPASGSAGRLAA